MNMSQKFRSPAARIRGLSLIELMIGITLGMLVVAAVLTIYVNIARTNSELAKMNRQIENGRFAIQVLHEDIVHAGYWGTFIPKFDNLTAERTIVPNDAPNALPDPCLTYNAANWTVDYISDLIGIPVQAYLGSCATPDRLANTDTLVVRHAQTCVAGAGGNCEADTAGKMYFQSTRCANSISGIAEGASPTTIALSPADASSVDDFYVGQTINIIAGTGAGQSRVVTDYDGTTKIATVSPAWSPQPVANVSEYAFGNGRGYVLGNSGFNLLGLDCNPANPAEKRQFISNIYYIRNYARTAGDGIPTLMRASFDLAGGVLAHQTAQPLIEGIEGFRVEYGIDDLGDNGDVDYSKGIDWADLDTLDSPKFRGDGVPDRWVNQSAVDTVDDCSGTGVDQCDAANVVAVRIHVLARGLEASPGHADSKTYQLGDQTLGPYNDSFKRQVFSSTARLVNPSGRRETP